MRKLENINEENLNSTMEFDHVIRVHKDGTVSDGYPDLMAPEITMDVDADGSATDDSEDDLRRQARSYGWELLDAWTGQYGYRGVVMHSSEYIGGDLAEHILETPGYYVAVTVGCLGPDNEENPDAESFDPAGWAIAYRPAYKYLAAQQAEESGYGDESYWQGMDDHTDELLAKGYDVRDQNLGERLAGNDGD
jgi:hypothetical protein